MKKNDVHIFVWRPAYNVHIARHTKMCTSFFSSIPQGNEKNQQSILNTLARRSTHASCVILPLGCLHGFPLVVFYSRRVGAYILKTKSNFTVDIYTLF